MRKLWVSTLCFFTLLVHAVAQNLLIKDVHVYEVNNEKFSGPTDVIIREGIIEFVGKVRGRKRKAGLEVLEGKGKFLLPGFWDAHVHSARIAASDLATMVRYGVVGIRDMGGAPEIVNRYKHDSTNSNIPRISSAGLILESRRWLTNYERAFGKTDDRVGLFEIDEVKPAIDSILSLGGDFVKLRSASNPEMFKEIFRQAQANGLKLTGHVPMGVLTVEGAVDAGMSAVEHTFFMDLQQLSDSSRHATIQRLATKASFTPTMIIDYKSFFVADSVKRSIINTMNTEQEPRIAEISDELRAFWKEEIKKPGLPLELIQMVRSFHGITREIAEAGSNMLVGTDTPGPLVFPGSSLHDEMELMHDVLGMEPARILKAAVFNTPEWLELDDYGLVETGKIASLVLLDKNPLRDIRNTRSISAVIHRGTVIRP